MSALHAEYVARSTAPRLARKDVRAWAAPLPSDVAIDLVIAVNELVTNSVKHGPDFGRVRLAITPRPDDVLLVEVSDEGLPQSVVQRAPDTSSGRGLHMVQSVALDWGVSYHPTRTWFTLAVRPPAVRVLNS